ncbi:MAG: phenylacetate--CoA ligase family protein [Candidatus Zixiibacteriota bacterium]|nr:MAG: phenylacetate--CoA ligase family protein [candidate division Zixibacteria bacterium]
MRWLDTYALLQDMNRHLAWPPEALEKYRLWKLRERVRHAYFFSSFYRRRFEACGVHPDDLRTISDLRLLPLLDKDELRRTDPLEVVTRPPDTPWMVEMTSGSTGEPLRIYRTWNDLVPIKAKVIRAFTRTGFTLFQRQAVLKSSAESLTGRHWFERLGVLRKLWLSVSDPPEANLRRLRAFKPRHLHGYPSGLVQLAEWLEDHGQTLPIPHLCTGAEVLDPVSRRRIAAAFQAEVFDLYATREVGNIAWECRAHQGLHLNDDAMIVEILDERGEEAAPGVEGEVVVTYLDAADYPFIRYRLGDRAVRKAGPCPCGVTFSRLELVTGRCDDRILLPSGEWITGMVFQELRGTPWASALRLLQDDLASIRLQVVPRGSWQSADLEALAARVHDLVRGQLQVRPEVLADLPRDPSGKLRMVVCALPSPPSPVSAGDVS